jgi:hypothetical protein
MKANADRWAMAWSAQGTYRPNLDGAPTSVDSNARYLRGRQ